MALQPRPFLDRSTMPQPRPKPSKAPSGPADPRRPSPTLGPYLPSPAASPVAAAGALKQGLETPAMLNQLLSILQSIAAGNPTGGGSTGGGSRGQPRRPKSVNDSPFMAPFTGRSKRHRNMLK